MEAIPGTSGTRNTNYDDSDDSINCTPEEIKDKAQEVTLNLLPDKSKHRYNLQYKLFMDWCAANMVKKYSESVILTYMSELSKQFKSSTLWSIHSMLKATLSVKHDVDIGKYMKVNAFLKKNSIGHVAKKSKIFSSEEVRKFLRDAPDELHLLSKVSL